MMRLYQVLEAISQETVVKIFSQLVTAVNNMSDLVGEDGLSGKEAAQTLSELRVALESINARVSRLTIEGPTWDSVSSSMQFPKDTPKTWGTARALITRRLIPEILASADLVLQQPYGPEAQNAVRMLRERIMNAQAFLTGLAPVGQAAADAVDEQPVMPPATA